MISDEVYTRKLVSFMNAACVSSAAARLSEAATIAVGMPRATSSACVGPVSATTGLLPFIAFEMVSENRQ